MKVLLRNYQQEGLETVFSEYETGISQQLVVMATGLGKTRLGAAIIQEAQERFSNCKCLWLTHTEELIEQSAMALMNNLFPEHEEAFSVIQKQGVLKVTSWESNLFNSSDKIGYNVFKQNLGIIKKELMQIDKPIVIASIQTLQRRLEKMSPEEFDLIIVDEADLAAAPTWQKCLDYFDHSLRIGLTATPERLDGASLSHLFEKIVYDRDIKYGIDNKWLCEIDAIAIETGLSLDGIHTLGGELNQKELSATVDIPVRNIKIVNKYIEHAQGRPAIVFCVDMEHAQNLCEHFQRKNLRTAFVVSDTKLCPNRKELIQKFRNGEIDILTNVDILTAGFDYPDVGCIINAAPTKSKRKFLQRVGRGTRLKSASFVEQFGQNLLILDITDDTRKHSLVNAWALDKDKPIEDRVFVSKEKKEKLIEARILRELKHEQKFEEKINLLKLPEVTFNPYSKAHRENASDKQMTLLKSKGYDITDTAWTKMDAIKVISSFHASEAQIKMIKNMGYDVSSGLSIGQVNRIMEKHNKDKEKRLNAFVAEQNQRNIKLPIKGLN